MIVLAGYLLIGIALTSYWADTQERRRPRWMLGVMNVLFWPYGLAGKLDRSAKC